MPRRVRVPPVDYGDNLQTPSCPILRRHLAPICSAVDIEAVIGLLKTDGHLGRNFLKGRDGDHANAVRRRLQPPSGPQVAEDSLSPIPRRDPKRRVTSRTPIQPTLEPAHNKVRCPRNSDEGPEIHARLCVTL